MNKLLKKLGQDFELYIGSIFLSITSVIVVMNVFTRYFLKFTYAWAEEIAVGAFVWVIFLGLANSYKTGFLIGVEAVMKLLPKKARTVVEFIAATIVLVLSSIMFYFSLLYVASSTKLTNALELPYSIIYVSMIISFALITIYAIYFAVQSFRKIFIDPTIDNKELS